MKDCRRRKVGLSMVWINYGKTCDWYPTRGLKYPWRYMRLHFLSYLIFYPRVWQTILKSDNEELATVNIQREIFQGDIVMEDIFQKILLWILV